MYKRQVKAPWAGIVLSLTCEVDDELEANTTPCVVADLSSIVVNAELSELDVDKVTTEMCIRDRFIGVASFSCF